jgi:hypothetical protein
MNNIPTAMSTTNTTRQTLEEYFKASHPVGQCYCNARYGFHYIPNTDVVDVRQARYATRQKAEKARDIAARRYAMEQDCGHRAKPRRSVPNRQTMFPIPRFQTPSPNHHQLSATKKLVLKIINHAQLLDAFNAENQIPLGRPRYTQANVVEDDRGSLLVAFRGSTRVVGLPTTGAPIIEFTPMEGGAVQPNNPRYTETAKHLRWTAND